MFGAIRLENGVTLALETIPFVRSISFGIWVGNGSRHENKQSNGMSHFIEHMLFKGTESRSAKEIADEMDAIGGQINAYTSKEYTCYHTRTLDTHFDTALEVLSDMFFHSKFDDHEIVKEKNVVMEEIFMYEDSPEDLAHEILNASVWNTSPLGYPILGVEETLQTFNKANVTQYYQNHYHPENTVIAVAGNFDEDEMIQKLKNTFGSWTVHIPYQKSVEKAEYKPGIVTRQKDIEQVHLCLGFEGIPVGSDKSYTLSVFNTIFGGGISSRLFQRIREDRGLTYSVYSYSSNYMETGLYTIYAGMSASQTEEVIKLIINEIRNLNHDKIDDITIEKTKEQLKSNYIIGLESTANRMSSMGRSQLRLGKIQTPDEVLQKVDQVTKEDVESLYLELLDFDKLSLSAAGKIDGIDFERIVQKYV